MAASAREGSGGHSKHKHRQERFYVQIALELLELLDGDKSDLKNLSDNDDAILDADNQPSPREQSSSEDDSSDDEDPIPQPTEHSRGRKHLRGENKGRGMRWRATPLTPNLAEFEHEDETEQDRNGWTPLNYFEQYIDKDLMKIISDCSNAMSLSRSGGLLNTSVDEVYHFFGACILMSCVQYPKIRMYWSNALRFTAITDRFTRDRFFRLR
ncbi:uncharacterized protein LOC130123472 [Lampris incognitus]|uniref:uncharacterized protein LOC130123472 n=1 Tax=Lampris incognitus TaxID=2546036 RepID=UPI0024B57868|nr:uncharacterized protein LOC130123472 [Lampris incognitus]